MSKKASIYRTIVHIFDVSSYSGTKSYSFQHKTTAGILTTSASITAIALYDGEDQLICDLQQLSSPLEATSSAWETIIQSTGITLSSQGGLYISASLQNQKTSGGSAVVSGEWLLQYKLSSESSWIDLNYPIFRSPLGEQIGMASLVASLPDNTPAGTYDFRVAHRRISGPSPHALMTQKCNLAIVSLGTPNGYFPVFSSTKLTASTTSTSLTPVFENIIKPQSGTNLFVHAQYEVQSSGQTSPCMHDIIMKKGNTVITDGMNFSKYLHNNTHCCSGSVSCYISGLEKDSTYYLDFRHASNNSRSLTTRKSYMVAFGTYRASEKFISPVIVNSSDGLLSGAYKNLKPAFDDINNGVFKGEIAIMIYDNISETSSCVLNASGTGNSDYSSILMYPAANNITISTTLSGSLIHFLGADNVTIDGRANLIGDAALTIQNLENSNSNARTLRFENSAENNSIRYCNIKGSSPATSAGVIFFSNSSSGNGNCNNTIEYCNITNAGSRPSNLIYSAGTVGRRNSNISIINNNFSNFLRSQNSSNAINIVSNSELWTIQGNSFFDSDTISPQGAYVYTVIRINTSDANNYTVQDNYFGGKASLCLGGKWTINSSLPHYFRIISINSSNLSDLSIIQGNTIREFDYTSTSGNPFDGIYLYSGRTNVTNNTIGDTLTTNSIILRAPSAYLTANISGDGVSSVNIVGSGFGYNNPPVISFGGGGGSGAEATATINSNGEITAITITNTGSGYTSVPSVRINNVYHSYSTFHGIWIRNTSDITVSNNIIGSITTIGSDYYVFGFEGIYKTVSTNGSVLLENNIIGSTTVENSINISSTGSLASDGQRVYGIYFQGNDNAIINYNTIANISNSYSGTNNSTSTIGIYCNRGNATIQNNRVFNIKTSSANTGGASSASVFGIGIYNSGTGLNQKISENKVYNIFNLNPSARVDAYGIYYSGSNATWGEVSSNYVSNVVINSSDIGSSVDGIVLYVGKTNVYNNIISLGTNISNNVLIYGIFDQASWQSDLNLYYNTVVLEGNVSGPTSSSFAYYNRTSSSTPRNVKNNIFANLRNGGTSGKHYAVRLGTMTYMTIDYNNYYAPNGVLAYMSSDKTTLAAWQSATSQDVNSYNADPQFTGTGNEHEAFYPFPMNGEAISGFETDYTGHSRNISNPKIGALELYEIVWQGSINTDFNTAGNWLGGIVPDDGADIRFADNPDNHCILDQNRIIGSITNSSNKNLVINGKNLQVKGNISFTGTGLIDGSINESAIEFAGDIKQVLPSNKFLLSKIDSLIINNPIGVIINNNFTVNKGLVLSSGVFEIDTNCLILNGSISQLLGQLCGGDSSSVIFAGNSNSTALPQVSLKKLTIDRPNGINFSGNVTITDSLVLSTGLLTLNGNSLLMQGNNLIVGAGQINASNVSDNLMMNNTVNILFPDNLFSDAINVLTVNGVGVTSEGNITINREINLASSNPLSTKGLVDFINDKELTMGANAITSGQGDVTGIVKRTSFLENVAYSFGNRFTTISFIPGGTYPSFIKCKIRIGNAPSWKADAVIRYYDFIQSSGNNCFATISTFYLDAELNGIDESDLSQWTFGANGQLPDGAYDWGFSNYNITENWVEIAMVNIGYFPTVFGNLENTLAATITEYNVWNGSVSNDWTNALNWTPNSVPGAVSYVVIPNAGTTDHDPILPAATEIKKIWLHSGAVLNADATSELTLNGNVGTWINSGGTLNPAQSTVIFSNENSSISGTTSFYNLETGANDTLWMTANCHIKIAGEIINNGAIRTVIAGETTLEYNGENQTIIIPNTSTNRLYNVILSGSGIKNMPFSDITIMGNLEILEQATLNLNSAIVLHNNLFIDSDAVLNAGNFTHNLKKNIICNGQINNAINTTFIFNGNSHQQISASSPIILNNLTLDNITNLSLFGNLTVNKTLNLTEGNLIMGADTLTINGNIQKTNGSITPCSYCSLRIGGTSGLTFNNNLFTNTPELACLILNNTDSVSLGNQDISILNNLKLLNGEFNISNRKLTMFGVIEKTNGSITTNSSTQIEIKDNPQQLEFPENLFSTNPLLFNLLVDRVQGLKLSNQNVEVTNKLILSNGIIYSNSSGIIHLANSASVGTDTSNNTPGSSNSYVSGQFRKTGNTAFTFPIGDTVHYAPISVSADLSGSNNEHFTASYFSYSPNSQGYNVLSKDSELSQVSSLEFWNIEQSTGGTNQVNVTLYWDSIRSGTFNYIPDLRVAHWNGTIWENMGAFSSSGTAESGYITSDLISSFSPFTLASISEMNNLPVVLKSFNADCNNNNIEINWTCSSEINNDFFTIESSADAINWITEEIIQARGNANYETHYQFNINNNENAYKYFRLKQTDFDGTTVVLKTSTVICNESENSAKVYPVPASSFITVELALDNSSTIYITDITGREIFSQKHCENISIINVESFNPGLYNLHIKNEIINEIFKIIIE
ncbi:MAG: hypothetical protein JXR58_05370 [Bacteroidales bacterium]|nr:hypothetical protein [Bacteroidales bacterium]